MKQMSKTEYRQALELLELSNRGFCLEVLDVGERSGRNWKSGEVPVPNSVAALLRLCIRLKISGARLRELLS